MQKIIIGFIKIYQKILSFDTGIIGKIYPHQPTCRFHPRCSDYVIQAINKYGLSKGLLLGSRRIVKCHPWNEGGIDNP